MDRSCGVFAREGPSPFRRRFTPGLAEDEKYPFFYPVNGPSGASVTSLGYRVLSFSGKPDIDAGFSKFSE